MSKKLKTILIPISNGFFARNFLRTDAYRILESTPSVRLVLLAPAGKIEYYKQQFKSPRVIFELLPETADIRSERIYKFLETSSIKTDTVWMLNKSEFGKSGGKSNILSRLVIYGGRTFLWWMGGLKWWRWAIRATYSRISTNAYGTFFEKYKPDLVFVPSLVYNDYIFLREAKKRGIKSAGMVLSWDNLYSKTFLRVHPDLLVVHTKIIADQAVTFGDFPREKISVVGIPQYDRYFKKEGILSREEFIKSIGGDPAEKLILYAFSGKAGLHVDFDMVGILDGFMKANKINVDANVLVRPYPRYDLPEDRIISMRREYGFLAEPAMAHVGGGKGDWEFDDRSLSLLINSLVHSDIIITMYSTFFIEGAIFNKPLIGVAYDGDKILPYWNSVSRFFSEWDHLRDLDHCGGIKLVRSNEEFLEAINTYFAHGENESDGRKKIIDEEVNFTDGKAGERLANVLITALN